MAFSSRFLVLFPILISILAVAARNTIVKSSFRDLINYDQDLTNFLQQEEEQQLHGRGLGEDRLFGQRCGNRNSCVEGQDCAEVSMGNRCLPNTCLQEHAGMFTNGFDINTYKQDLYGDAGFTEDQVLTALASAKNERDFMEMPEFQALEASLHANLEPLRRMQELSNTCVSPYQDAGTVSYMGLHIEASAIFDISFQYLITSNSANATDTRTVLRLCLGAELGVGAEIAYVFGFTNTNETANMLCVGWYADVDIVILVAAGAAILCGFNGVFSYEFTFGGGAGLGLGTGFCAGFEQTGNTTVANQSIPGL